MKKLMKKLSLVLVAAMMLTMVSMNATKTYAEEMTEDEILTAAAALAEGESMTGTQTLTGVITEIVTAYSEQYSNISVMIKVKETSIEAFRLAGGSELKVGDKIKVTGTITNYKGTVEFGAKCTYEMVEAAQTTPEPTAEPTATPAAAMTEAEILAAAAALEEGKSMEGTQTLTGVITSITTAYDASYNNITVVMKVADTEITAYRLAGGSDLKVGDKITVTGTIQNYKGTVEFGAKCTYTTASKTPNTGVTSELPVVAMIAIVALFGAAFFGFESKRKNVQ